jgi:hypothetical protein
MTLINVVYSHVTYCTVSVYFYIHLVSLFVTW